MIDKLIRRNNMAEMKLLNKKKGMIQKRVDPTLDGIKEKIPPKVKETVNFLFEKAFYSVFEKGTSIIEKTYDKENLEAQYIANDYMYEKTKNRRSIRRIENGVKRAKFFGKNIAFVEGAVLGVLGIGLPDIVIFTGFLLKGIYEISLSYGFDYTKYEEKLYILKLIQVVLSEDKSIKNAHLDKFAQDIENGNWSGSINEEISLTASAMSEDLFFAKFIQGLPIIGISGAFFNRNIYKKISDFASVKYKKRYLEKKQMNGNIQPY